jgi:hypothetical protein
VLKALGKPADPRLRKAMALLRDWARRGGHRRDLNKDGHYDDDRAVTLMDAWWPRLVGAAFRPTLGATAFSSLSSMNPLGDHTDSAPRAADFYYGWWGYVSKDLRGLLKARPKARRVRRGGKVVVRRSKDPIKGRYSRAYCGRGSLKRCRTVLRASLLDALPVTKQSLYGRGPCRTKPEASCFDMNRSTVTSALAIPDFPFQNRPTFQQVVQVEKRLPR